MNLKDPLPEVPPGLTPEARRANKRFHRKVSGFHRKVNSVAFNILVWGKSPTSDSPVARKRVEIRNALKQLGHNALFSEDIPSTASNAYDSEKTKEFPQAMAADFIIVLVEDAPGASAEAHDFGNHPDIAVKIVVFVPERYSEGYSAKGAIKDLEDGYGGVYRYAPSELTECRVLTKAVTRVEARRNMVYRHGGRRP